MCCVDMTQNLIIIPTVTFTDENNTIIINNLLV